MSTSVLIKLARRIGVLCVLGVAAGSAAMASAQAQEYPNKPIRVIVPYGAGQATDLMCRVFLEQLKTVLKQSIVIENRPGAATNIGAAFVAKAPPDGYTLLCTGNATSVANPLLYENMGFDPDKDLTPITAVAATGFLLLAGSEYKDRSLQDLIAKARTSPQPLLVGLASTTATVIYGMVQEAARIPLSRVPYTGGNTGLFPDLMRGETNLVIEAMPSAMGLMQGQNVTPLAVTLPTRSKLLPNVPTFREAGLDVTLVGWNGFYAPSGLAPEILAQLSRAAIEALNNPAVAKGFEPIASVPMPTTPDELRKITLEDREKWRPMVKLLNLKAN